MKLVIHCGCHKTGTTSFQIFCTENRPLLRSTGIHYPAYGKRTQHSYLMWDAQQNGLDTIGAYLRESYAQAKADCHTVLLSGEDFENCIVDVALATEIEALARDAGFDTLVWVVVTRPMNDLVTSFYAQKSKRGVVLSFDTVQRAATQRGCFYVSTAEYDYIHVLDYTRFAPRFRQYVSGQVVEYDFASFVQDHPGMILLKQLLPEEVFTQFRQTAKIGNKHANKRLSERDVEENYIATALGLGSFNGRKRILRPMLAPFIWLRCRKRKTL